TKLGDNFEVKGGKVTYNQTPTDDYEVVNKKYADSLGWDLKVNGTKQGDTITHGKAVNFANGDNTTVKFEDNAVKVSVNTTALTATDGKVDNPATGGDNLTTAQNVADMINQTYWIASDSKNSANVSAGNTITWTGGKYTDVALSGNTFTVKSTLDIQQNAAGDVVIKDGDTVLANIAKGSDTVTSVEAGDSNIVVTPDMTDPSKPKYTVALNPNVDLGDSGSLKTGDTTINNNGVTVGGVSLTKDGLDNGGNKITHVAAGVDDTDAVNVGQLNDAITNVNTTINSNVNKVIYGTDNPTDKEKGWLKTYNANSDGVRTTNVVAEAIHNMNEYGIKYFHTNDGTTNPQANETNTDDSIAGGTYATAIGWQARANGESALAMGNGAKATGVNAISIGAGNIVSGSQSIAVGTNLTVNGNNSGAFGDPTVIDGANSYSVGNGNIISTNNTFALGNQITQTKENSVFLGDKAAYTAAGVSTAGSETYATNHEDIVNANGDVVIAAGELKFAGSHADTGVVSVGDVGAERRIQNVAPGKLSADSTDAINGSQLYSVAQQVGKVSSGGAGIVQYSNPDDPTTP
ncbi:MAG: hypothetical protein J6T41_06380, partial [Neisseriaceae bacterium]|nr:hypothetical protein [Neisseriaceae bacterium]